MINHGHKYFLVSNTGKNLNVTNYQRNSSTPSSGRGRGHGGKGGKGIPRGNMGSNQGPAVAGKRRGPIFRAIRAMRGRTKTTLWHQQTFK